MIGMISGKFISLQSIKDLLSI